MKPTGELPADTDDHIRHRAHAAHDQLRLYFSLRVLSEALPTRRRGSTPQQRPCRMRSPAASSPRQRQT
jgi:hypothetical protein